MKAEEVNVQRDAVLAVMGDEVIAQGWEFKSIEWIGDGQYMAHLWRWHNRVVAGYGRTPLAAVKDATQQALRARAEGTSERAE